MKYEVPSKKATFLFLLIFHLFLFSVNSIAQNGRITGHVVESQTGTHLPGANIIIVGTSFGASSQLDGRFIIPQIPFGDYQLKVSYVGFNSKTMNITLSAGNEIVEVKVELEHAVISGETVVVTGQAAAQAKAINQEISANNAKSVISAERIQELPEVSAAEAVGRLPGVSLKDDEIVVRGMSPHYNNIQIDGFDMASTNDFERSSGLGMISQYMLGGVELTKSAMANQEANVIGGTVNLIMKEAPEKATYSVLLEDGYNTLSTSYANPKVVLNASDRFYDGKLGALLLFSYEKAIGGTDQMGASYEEGLVDGFEKMTLGGVSLRDINTDMKNRIGTSLVLDYTTSTTKAKFSNFFSSKNAENTIRQANFSRSTNSHSILFEEEDVTVLNNALQIEHYLGGYKLDASFAHSYSKKDFPDGVGTFFEDRSLFPELTFLDFHPVDALDNASREFNINGAVVRDLEKITKYNENRQLSAKFNIQKDFNLTDWLAIDLEMGGKIKHQSKKFDREFVTVHWSWDDAWAGVMGELIGSGKAWLPDNTEDLKPLEQYMNSPIFGANYVVDEDYSNKDLLVGDYELKDMPDPGKVRELYDLAYNGGYFYNKHSESYGTDYHGTEDYLAAYILPQIKLFNDFTFIPGLRYERNQTEYTAWRVPYLGFETIDAPWTEIVNYDVTRKRENEFFLPMLHGIYRPNEWFNVKASYTHTLSRPRFGDIIPRWRIDEKVVSIYNDPYLKPALSKNIDLYLSFYENKLGLLTIGGYTKTIEDLIFNHGTIPLNQLGTSEEIAGMFDGLPGETVIGKEIDWRTNNPEDATLNGLEVSWQTSFWYLPGILKGLVLNVNYTKLNSKAKYPIVNKTQSITGYDTTSVFGQTIITPIRETIYTDTAYTSRIIDQADDLLNLTIGYDYKDFSIRGSMKYTDDLFSRAERNENFREFTQARTSYDVTIRQKFPLMNADFDAYLNIVNIGRSQYAQINKGTGYPTIERYGGIGLALGLKVSIK
jgi:TonB-dependent receptor